MFGVDSARNSHQDGAGHDLLWFVPMLPEEVLECAVLCPGLFKLFKRLGVWTAFNLHNVDGGVMFPHPG